MSYYGSDLDTSETSFEDPTAELEANGEADDLGDGLARRKRVIEDEDLDLIRTRTERTARWR